MRKMRRFLGFTLTTIFTLSLVFGNALILNVDAADSGVHVHYSDVSNVDHGEVYVSLDGGNTYVAYTLLPQGNTLLKGSFTHDLDDVSRAIVQKVILYWNADTDPTTFTEFEIWHESAVGNGNGLDVLNIRIGDPIQTSSPPPSETTPPPSETTAPPSETTPPPSETTPPPSETTPPPSETTPPPSETTPPPTVTPTPIVTQPPYYPPYTPPSTPTPTLSPSPTPIILPTPSIPAGGVTPTPAPVPKATTEVTIVGNTPAAGLPQTSTVPADVFYGLGMMLGLFGLSITRIRKGKKS